MVMEEKPMPSGGFGRRIPAYTRFVVGIPVFGLFAGAVTAYSGEADRPFRDKAISNPVQADRSGAKRRGLGLKAT
jgi:hypothetical protein